LENIIAILLEKPEFPKFLAFPLMFVAGVLVILRLSSGVGTEVVQVIARLWPLYRNKLHDDLALMLHAALDWPELPRRSLRPVSLWNALIAFGLMAGALLFFGYYVAVALNMIFIAPGATHPASHYVIAPLFMLLCIASSRSFAIAGVKQWYGIR
jgi:hypothetical protein